MLSPKRKSRLSGYSLKHNGLAALLLIMLFACGLLISRIPGGETVIVYLVLWVISYVVLFAGTCRYCAYYGKRCPIPFEGACVNRFFGKKKLDFGWLQLLWATAAYALRVLVPYWIILQERLIGWGAVYVGLLLLFWTVHLRVSGCPNCINTKCPLNPGVA